jgi:hypothetical protein
MLKVAPEIVDEEEPGFEELEEEEVLLNWLPESKEAEESWSAGGDAVTTSELGDEEGDAGDEPGLEESGDEEEDSLARDWVAARDASADVDPESLELAAIIPSDWPSVELVKELDVESESSKAFAWESEEDGCCWWPESVDNCCCGPALLYPPFIILLIMLLMLWFVWTVLPPLL